MFPWGSGGGNWGTRVSALTEALHCGGGLPGHWLGSLMGCLQGGLFCTGVPGVGW